MFKSKLENLFKDRDVAKELPESIRVPAFGTNTEEVVKPIEEATIDELVFAAQALDRASNAILRLYSEARSKGALGSENIVTALSKGGVL